MRSPEPSTREKVESKLGYALTDVAWDAADELGWIDDYEMYGARSLDELIDKFRDLTSRRRSAREAPDAAEDRDPAQDARLSLRLRTRARALAQAVTAFASHDADIAAFRRRYLAQGLVPLPALNRWMTEATKRERARFTPRNRHHELVPFTGGWAGIEGMDPPAVELHFQIPGHYRTLTVPPSGILGELVQLAGRLAYHYGWSAASAATYVLTGATTPAVVPIRVETSRVRTRIRAARRITLTVDPDVNPNELAPYWSNLRAARFDDTFRPQSAKHMTLAAFAMCSPETESWWECMTRWNAAHPDWGYEHESNFRRDASGAVDRLLGLP